MNVSACEYKDTKKPSWDDLNEMVQYQSKRIKSLTDELCETRERFSEIDKENKELKELFEIISKAVKAESDSEKDEVRDEILKKAMEMIKRTLKD